MKKCYSYLHMKYMTIVHHSLSLWWFQGSWQALAGNVWIDTSIDKGVWVWSYCTDKPSSTNDSALVILSAHRTPKPLNNNIDKQPTADDRQAASGDWHTIKGRNTVNHQLVRQQTAGGSTETTKWSIGASMEWVFLLLAGFLSLTEGQSELGHYKWQLSVYPYTCYCHL